MDSHQFHDPYSPIYQNGDFVIAIEAIVKSEALHPEKRTLNVEYLARERTKNFMTGPVMLPVKGFDLK
jgi:hypothetical protein